MLCLGLILGFYNYSDYKKKITYHQDRPISGQRHQTEPVSQIFKEGSV